MRVAIIGASGFVGTTILSEALSHDDLEITAIVRNVEALPRNPKLTPRDSSDAYEQSIAGHRSIIESVRASGITRSDRESGLRSFDSATTTCCLTRRVAAAFRCKTSHTQ
jgi:putative NADH-flavin reductase